MKLTDTRWLAHKHYVKAVKASYSSIVLARENIYETSHEPEALGLSKALSSHSTIAAMYLLDYILPQVAKLSHALQTKHLDLSLISSLVDATLNSLDDAILPSANLVLQLQDAREELKAATGIEVTHLDICSFQERVGKPFMRLIKDNISSWFRSSLKDVLLLAFSIFDPKKVPSLSLMTYLYMETVQFKLSWDSLGEIYQLNHWQEWNLRRQSLSLLTSVQSGKLIASSLLSSQKMIYPTYNISYHSYAVLTTLLCTYIYHTIAM